MFGIGDNKDQNTNFDNAYDSGVAVKPLNEYQNAPAAHTPPMPGFNNPSSMPMPAQGAPNPPAMQTAPPLPGQGSDTVPLMAPPQPASAPPLPESSEPKPNESSVSLDNAYIADTPPHLTDKPTDTASKPSAASLFNSSNDDDLLKMKQQALHNLEPLIDKLDQSPEEKFKTTMMLIQASDNSELIKDAYEAAQSIKDEKVKAQALLDVVNEINYFTQQSQTAGEPSPAGQII